MSPAPQSESKVATLIRRLTSTVILLGVVFYGLLGGSPISVFLVGGIIMLLNVAGLLEFYGMVNANSLPRFKWLGLAGGITLVGTLFVYLSGLAKQQLGEPTTGGAAELELGIFAVPAAGAAGAAGVRASGGTVIFDGGPHDARRAVCVVAAGFPAEDLLFRRAR